MVWLGSPLIAHFDAGGQMAPSKQYSEGGQLQLMDAERIEEEEECFESIDKRTPSASSPSLPHTVLTPSELAQVGGPSGLRKTTPQANSLAHRTTWLDPTLIAERELDAGWCCDDMLPCQTT